MRDAAYTLNRPTICLTGNGRSGVWYLAVVGAAAIVVSLYLPRGPWGTLAHRTGFAVLPVRHTVRS